MPHRSSVPMSWRLAKHRYMIIGTKCECGQLYFPPRAVCECGHSDLKPVIFSGRGEIVSHTEIHIGPAGFEDTPYNVALIRLDEGPVISGLIVDSKIEIGQNVRAVFRKLTTDGEEGLINYGFKFEVV